MWHSNGFTLESPWGRMSEHPRARTRPRRTHRVAVGDRRSTRGGYIYIHICIYMLGSAPAFVVPSRGRARASEKGFTTTNKKHTNERARPRAPFFAACAFLYGLQGASRSRRCVCVACGVCVCVQWSMCVLDVCVCVCGVPRTCALLSASSAPSTHTPHHAPTSPLCVPSLSFHLFVHRPECGRTTRRT